MDHVLDNPAWNALNSGNASLALGTETVKFFRKEVSPFVGFSKNTSANFQDFYNLATKGSTFGFISTEEIVIPEPWELVLTLKCLQMICEGPISPPDSNIELKELTEEHIPKMVALTKLTNPGPFAERTINFGHYRGIFDDERLVAMAGQRMHVFNYAEVSAVCTHPGYLGRGYAKALLQYQVNRIFAAGEIPFLHVRNDNYRAIEVYKSLGFVTRREINFYIIKK